MQTFPRGLNTSLSKTLVRTGVVMGMPEIIQVVSCSFLCEVTHENTYTFIHTNPLAVRYSTASMAKDFMDLRTGSIYYFLSSRRSRTKLKVHFRWRKVGFVLFLLPMIKDEVQIRGYVSVNLG